MKLNFKKVASILATTAMLGSTIAFASAAWPSPFIKDGSGDAALVYGSSAASTDMAAATDLGAALDAKVTVGAGTISGTGDQSTLATSARKLYYGDSINAPKLSLSSSEMPAVLADGKVTDLSGVEYKYTQAILLGNTVSSYGTSGGDIKDPTLYLEVGTDSADALYSYQLSLQKNLNSSDGTNVQGQKIKILGVDYVIGANSLGTTALYLYGSGETISLNGGDSKTVTIQGKEHTVELVGATATNTAKITVDGVSKTVTKGSSYAFAGDVNIYAKDITYQAYAGGLQSGEFIIGANTLLLQNGAAVKRGADQTTVQGTLVTITGESASGKISGITVNVTANRSQLDDIRMGGSFVDPVFGGLKVQFPTINPTLEDASRAKIKVRTDNNQYAYITLTTARAGTTGEKEITYSFDSDSTSTGVYTSLLHQSNASSGKGKIIVNEGDRAKLNDWIVVNQGDAGTILQVDDISITSSDLTGTVTFSDVITGDSSGAITLTNSTCDATHNAGCYIKTGVNMFGGNGYSIQANATSLNITWATAASTKTVFPRIKLKDGGWMAFLSATAAPVANGSLVILPNGLTTLATTGTNLTCEAPSGKVQNANGINWGLNCSNTETVMINSITGVGGCTFNSSTGPAILYMEPKKWDDSSFGDFVCIPMSTTGTKELAIGSPAMNGTNSGLTTWDSDTYKSSAVDKYGAYIVYEQRTNENNVATIMAPASQMYFDVLFTAESVTQGAAKVKVVKDTEVNSVSSSNLIAVGGACINTVAAKILGSDAPLCGDAWTEKTGAGAGKYLIQVVASPYNAQKVAMLVAGYDAADTTTAVAKVKEGTVSTDVGTKKVLPETSA